MDSVIQDVTNNNDQYCSYHLILMDSNMPILDGNEATKQIRQFLYSKSLDQPIIIAVTGHSENSYIERAL